MYIYIYDIQFTQEICSHQAVSKYACTWGKIKIKIYKRNNSAKVKKKCFSNSFLEFIYKVYNNPIKWTIKYFT